MDDFGLPNFDDGGDYDAMAHVRFLRNSGGASSGYTADMIELLYQSLPAHEELTRLRALNAELVEALENLANAKALAGIREMVAGWNGEGLPQPYLERHPARLGANIRTNCGAIYALDEALTAARDTLSKARGEDA